MSRIGRIGAAVTAAAAVVLSTLVAAPATAAQSGHFAGHTANGDWVLDVPASFNGTLLLWSHGYTFTPVTASDAPSDATRDELLDEGYALAGSSYAHGGAGWAVNEGVRAAVELIAKSKTTIGAGQVHRVYAWGNSLGGLITAELAQRRPDLVAGVAPLCGVLAGTNRNLDLALDVAVGVKTFFYPQLRLRGYHSAAQAQANLDGAMAAILGQLNDPARQPGAIARLIGLSALTGAPAQTRDFSGATLQSATAAAVETIQTALTYGTLGRYDIETRVGGNPSTNASTDYRKRVSAAAVNRFTAFGFTRSLLSAYAQTLQTYGARVAAAKSARTAANGLGLPAGKLSDKTVTMHTQYDPLVLVQNERVFADRVAAHGRSARLRQLWVVPPAYSDGSPSIRDDGAPYGAGHCNFSTTNYLAAVHALNTWVRTGTYQSPEQVDGLRNTLSVPAWPAR